VADERPRTTHLDASVAHVETALLARAGQAGSHLDVVRRQARMNGLSASEPFLGTLAGAVAEIVATELRALAEELHYS
jgi:hypothetical protein